jgi:transposase
LEQAVERIAELEARLASNSKNSSRPPSSDGLGKPAPKTPSLRGATARKPDGQPGHEGRTLSQMARPKWTKVHEPGPCGCGRSLEGRPITGVERRQCFDLPPVLIEVTEHQLVERECSCGARTRASAPAGVDAPVQYGPRITAIVVYLYVGQFLSRLRTAQTLADLLTTPSRPRSAIPGYMYVRSKKEIAVAGLIASHIDIRMLVDSRSPDGAVGIGEAFVREPVPTTQGLGRGRSMVPEYSAEMPDGSVVKARFDSAFGTRISTASSA